MDIQQLVEDLVFGPHNTTTILVLTLTLSYFGVLVPRPTHKRAQDLVDSKTKTIDTLLTEYKESLKDIGETLEEIEVNVSQIREDVQDVGRKVEKNGCTHVCNGEGRDNGTT